MNKYKVKLTHQYTQEVEVYAENEDQAFHIACQSDDGINCDDCIYDSEVTEVDI